MSTIYFDTQEDMDDHFEDMMESETEKARLEDRISEQEIYIDNLLSDLKAARKELADMQEELDDLQN